MHVVFAGALTGLAIAVILVVVWAHKVPHPLTSKWCAYSQLCQTTKKVSR